ncbi:MAG: 2-dehydropantoate 2-reductase [Magnetococcales bacterium]|nr:2-dehydropantoate 2-reductase [Magnetococcales bacterium]
MSSPRPAAPTNILVVGTGAVGGYYGAQLAKAGARVSTTHRSDFATVQAHGIQIDGMQGPYHFQPAQVLQSVADYNGFPDYILVGLKVLEEIATADIIRPAVGPDTTILLLQNGVETEPPVAAAFPNNEILSGLAFVCLSRTAPGHIRHTCYGHLAIGRFPDGPSHAARQLAHLFETAGTPCSVTENIVLDRWKKLVWNAAFNPVSVLGQATTQEILAHPPTAQLVEQLMTEVCQIAAATGYPLPADCVPKNLAATRKMKPYKTSMLLDYLAGRSMEVEAILGNALRAAQRHHVAAPHLENLYSLLSLLAQRTDATPATTG